MSTPVYDLPQFARLKSFMHLVAHIIDTHSDAETIGMKKIPHKPADGFIPSTDGGLTQDFFFKLQDYAMRANEPNPIFPDAIAAILVQNAQNHYIDSVSAFASDRMDHSEPIRTLDKANAFLSNLDDDRNNDYEEFVSEHGFEDVRFRVRVGFTYKESEEHPLYFFVSLNTDDPYFRDRGEFRGQTGSEAPVDFLLFSQAIKVNAVPADKQPDNLARLYEDWSFDELARAHSMISAAFSVKAASETLADPLLLALLDEYSESFHAEDEDVRTQCEKNIAGELLALDPDIAEHIEHDKVFACHVYEGGNREEDVIPPYHAFGMLDDVRTCDDAERNIPVTLTRGFVTRHRENAVDLVRDGIAGSRLTLEQANNLLNNLDEQIKERSIFVHSRLARDPVHEAMLPFLIYGHSLNTSETDLGGLKQALSGNAEASHARP